MSERGNTRLTHRSALRCRRLKRDNGEVWPLAFGVHVSDRLVPANSR